MGKNCSPSRPSCTASYSDGYGVDKRLSQRGCSGESYSHLGVSHRYHSLPNPYGIGGAKADHPDDTLPYLDLYLKRRQEHMVSLPVGAPVAEQFPRLLPHDHGYNVWNAAIVNFFTNIQQAYSNTTLSATDADVRAIRDFPDEYVYPSWMHGEIVAHVYIKAFLSYTIKLPPSSPHHLFFLLSAGDC